MGRKKKVILEVEKSGKKEEGKRGFFQIDDKLEHDKVDMVIPKGAAQENEDKGGSVERSIGERAKREKEEREETKKQNAVIRGKLNEAADVILSCLDKSAAQEIRLAAKDYKIKDIGLYILGLMNRLIKTVDYYEPDIEPEWESGKVGYSDIVKCRYCGIVIESPKNLQQIFCSNRCAKRDSDYSKTGVVFPAQYSSGNSDEEMDEKKWEQEQRRIGVR